MAKHECAKCGAPANYGRSYCEAHSYMEMRRGSRVAVVVARAELDSAVVGSDRYIEARETSPGGWHLTEVRWNDRLEVYERTAAYVVVGDIITDGRLELLVIAVGSACAMARSIDPPSRPSGPA